MGVARVFGHYAKHDQLQHALEHKVQADKSTTPPEESQEAPAILRKPNFCTPHGYRAE
jgi:hypothetical protein